MYHQKAPRTLLNACAFNNTLVITEPYDLIKVLSDGKDGEIE